MDTSELKIIASEWMMRSRRNPVECEQIGAKLFDAAEEIDRLRAERDEADRRAGAAERSLADARDSIGRRQFWLSKAKREWGVSDNVSFDVVWAEALKLKDELAAARGDAAVLKRGLLAVEALIDSSQGVAGLHLNGDVAGWTTLREGGHFESWLIEFDQAIDNARKA